MPLENQIHVYTLDTSCFYTEKEMEWQRKLSKIYSLRRKISDKYEKKKISSINYERNKKRCNKIIKEFKLNLTEEFEKTRKIGKVRKLRTEVLVEKNIVSIFESDLTRILNLKTNELTEDLMIVQVYFFQVAEDIIKNGFYYNNEKYVLFTASAGQIRLKKFVVIKEKKFLENENTLTCGLTREKINELGGVNANKYLAYFALTNSATEVWKNFDIEKSIVVEDFETLVKGEVDFIDDITYEIKREFKEVPIPHMDGCGIMLDETTRMVRLPWVKGLMATFDFYKFILEKREEKHNSEIGKVKDIYGKEYDVIKDNIKYIFTKSQFKMWKYYKNWDEYKYNFHKYLCNANYCNMEEDYIKNANINYQMLQTLSDFPKKDLEKIARSSINDITKIGSDFQSMQRLLGVTKYNTHKNYMQQAIEIYPEIMRDPYNKEILKAVKKSLIKEAKSGRLNVNGKYCFVVPDLYAFCEWLFLGEENPNGLLENGEVYCSLFTGKKLDCLRSPHLYREHAIRKNVKTEETKKWFNTKCIYASCKDLISRVLQFDCDGDKLLIIQDRTICRVAEKNMKGIVPLYYDMKKAPNQILDNDSIFSGLRAAYTGGNIGIYSNNISKIWNSGDIGEEQLKVIKWLCMENNFVIDYAKTLYKPKRPEDVNEIIKEYTTSKLPNFFIYAKNKTKSQVCPPNESTVNVLNSLIPSERMIINKSIGKIDYTCLLKNREFVPDESIEDIIKEYDKINITKYKYYNNKDEKVKDNFELYLYKDIRNKILASFDYDIDFIVDSLVYYLYEKRKSKNKFTLWASFGDIILKNLRKNTKGLGKICVVCGKRFDGKGKVCSDDCYALKQGKIRK